MSAPFDLTWVITWLENGCDPKEAAKELRIYRDRMSASVPPAVTVDTPEFVAAKDALIAAGVQSSASGASGDVEAYLAAEDHFIEVVDAHTARAVAAAHQAGRLEAHNLHKRVTFKAMAQRDDALSAAQPVAGELPPLPAGYSVTRVDGHGWYVDPPHGGRWVAHEGTPAADFIAALGQPVQQPAAASDEPPYAFVRYSLDYIANSKKPLPDGETAALIKRGWAGYEGGIWRAAAAAVPAAGVHDEQERIHIGTRLRRVAKAAGVTVDYGDDAFYYAGAFSILGDIARVLEKPAAGVQGDAVYSAIMEKALSPTGYGAYLNGDQLAVHPDVLNSIVRYTVTTVQPDSGRDAAPPEFSRDPDGDLALDWVVGNALLSVSFSSTGAMSWATNVAGKSDSGSQQVVQGSGRDAALELARVALKNSEPVMRHYPEPVKRHADALAAVDAALAAHPAPSSDAALADEHAAFEAWCDREGFNRQSDIDKNGKQYMLNGTRARWTGWHARSIRAAHPAPSSDAAQMMSDAVRQVVEYVAGEKPINEWDSNGPDYLKCQACLGGVINNNGKATPEQIKHDADCPFVAATEILAAAPQKKEG